ncbi:1-acyl-sn-glycerol-3-phosphate acyltransferase [Litorivivens lipolytica]|uniref:1-acyl-sn-glycerol-3-phosphate acyltransferase n=1 Tax=Litorivivens lipolytica TaxID=1524264 RepID=A0A7W4W888_9GAMM|nr:lysophospholipid acyltransferase family protein [Litorivivens lipolytica]MBB3048642.1 1-acyl-sn-glycerol-3-phosphate acyltransferase [Litorivivens lipolytica]
MNLSLTRPVLFVRTLLFYIGYVLLTGWFSTTGILFFWFTPLSIRGRYLITWNQWILIWLRLTCGVRYNVVGSVPEGHYVVMAKHQSQWETFYLQHAFFPIGIVLKRELLKLPFFGWGLKLVDPIAIDRSNPKAALRYIMDEGTRRLKDGRRVLIFPEGTRTSVGQKGTYARSGANMAIAAGVPVVPVSHNAGVCWPPKKFLKYPGTITVVIGEPIATDNISSRELTAKVEGWIEAELDAMMKPAPTEAKLA